MRRIHLLTIVMLFKYGFTLHPLSYVPIYVSAGGCPLPTLQVALLATLNPGESIRFDCTHVGLIEKESASVLCESEENPASGAICCTLALQ